MLEPFLRSLASKYEDVEFLKIDVDELKDVAQQFSVNAMPTLVLLKQGKEVERIIGAKKDELEKKILQHREVPKFAAWFHLFHNMCVLQKRETIFVIWGRNYAFVLNNGWSLLFSFG